MDGLSMESCCEEQGQGGILLSLESHKAVPAPFLTKTYQLVDDPSTDHVVSWGDNHATFVVWRPPEFARDLLPNYFKHNNFSSFVRQLNTYGFRKIVPERWEFANEFFRKGEKHLLCEIHRRKTSSCASSSSQTPSPLPYQHYYHHSPSPPYFTGFFRPALSSPDSDELPLPSWCDTTSPVSSPGLVMGGNAVAAAASSSSSPAAAAAASALLDDNERLRRSNAMLLSELAHMRKLYNDIIYFVQNHVQPVAPSSSYPASSLLPAPNPCAQKLPAFYHHQQQQQQKQNETGTGKGCLMMNSSSTTSSSSLTIADEASPTNNQKNSSSSGEEESQKRGSSSGSSRPKLFGVPLGSSNKKRLLHPDEQEPTSPSPATKPRFVLNDEDLGFHLMPPSTCIAIN